MSDDLHAAIAALEGMVEAASSEPFCGTTDCPHTAYSGCSARRPSEAMGKLAARAPALAKLCVMQAKALEEIPCSYTNEWYGKRQHFDCGKSDCPRCAALAEFVRVMGP